MQEFKASEFFMLFRDLVGVHTKFKTELEESGDRGSFKANPKLALGRMLTRFGLMAHELAFMQTANAAFRAAKGLKKDASLSLVVSLLEESVRNVQNEALGQKFGYIEKDVQELFDNHFVLGDLVYKKFPSLRNEAREAGRCIACALPTAAVFHLMRIAEFGLRTLAKRLRATPKHPIDHSDWKQVIDACEAKLKILTMKPRGDKRVQELEFYATCISEANSFKHIWRNQVSHSLKRYSKSEAITVMERVRLFMSNLATRVKEQT